MVYCSVSSYGEVSNVIGFCPWFFFLLLLFSFLLWAQLFKSENLNEVFLFVLYFFLICLERHPINGTAICMLMLCESQVSCVSCN